MKLNDVLLVTPIFSFVGFGLTVIEKYGIDGMLASISIGVGITLLLFSVDKARKG